MQLQYGSGSGGKCMTVWELYKKLGRYPENMEVHVGCQGYTTLDDSPDEYELRVWSEDGKLMITDNCKY